MARRIIKIGVLVSGSGSNLQAIIDNIEQGKLSAQIVIVISNNPQSFALERAKKHNIHTAIVEHKDYPSREDFDLALIDVFRKNEVELVVMAGFTHLLSATFFNAYPSRVLNIHPALLPAFPGIHSQQRAFDYGVKFSGCSVHFADEGTDTGPVIIQAVVAVSPSETAETLADKILKEEHRVYSQAIQFYADGRISITGRKVFLKNVQTEEIPSLHNPPLECF